MKKFLTVLLALSVVFTYSFTTVGSAFAATDSEKAQALKDAKAVAEKIVANNFDEAMEQVAKERFASYIPKTTTDIDKAYTEAWAKIDVKGKLTEYINNAYVAESKTFDVYNKASYTSAEAYAAALFGFSSKTSEGALADAVAGLSDKIWSLALKEVLLNLYNADRTELLSALDKVDYSVYSTSVKKDDEDGRTYLQIAEDKIEAAKEEATEKGVYTLDSSNLEGATLTSAINDIESFVNGVVKAQEITVGDTTYKTGLYLVIGVETKDEVDADDAVDQATIAAQKAAAASVYAAFIKDNGSTYKSLADAWLEVVTFLADKGMLQKNPTYATVSKRLKNGEGTNIALNDTTYTTAVKTIEDLTAFAEKYKAEEDATGALVRDAEDVDNIVDEYTAYLYGNTYKVDTTKYNTYKTLNDAEEAIIAASVDSNAQKLAFAKEEYKAKLAKDLADLDVEENYYALEAATIQANYDAGIAKIEAATTPSKVVTAYRNVDLDKNADNKGDIDDLCKYAANSPEAIALEAVEAYVTYANTGKTILDEGYILWDKVKAKDAIEEVYGIAGARTATERKATTVDTASIVGTLDTVGGLAAAKKAAEDAIAALPSTITAADKDAVVAAWELAEAYADMTGAGALDNQTKLTNARNTLLNALKVDFAKKIAAVSKTDKEALKSLQAEIDAVNELFEEDEIFAGETKIDTNEIVADAIKSIRDKELDALIATINKLPINVTLDDKEQIEAARNAYDAFVEEWTDYEEPYNAVEKVTNFRELALAEAALSILEKDAAIKATESLKISVSTKLYTKSNKIRVNWKVKDGDASYIDGYQVYKSTKAHYNYKFMGKTTKNYMDNKKSLKKGQRYYYKVRAYVEIDGVKYYSDWSNKGNRIYK